MCEEFARAQVSDEVVQALRMGRMTALQKSSGAILGIVVGDFTRRLVARTLAQQLNPPMEQATPPFQFVLTTKSGYECVAHVAQALTDLDANATLLSVDGIGVFDLISKGVPCSKHCWRWKVAVPSSPLSDSSTVPINLLVGR